MDIDCQLTTRLYRMLESRSACIWKKLCDEIGRENVFSNMMTLTIICSFIPSDEITKNSEGKNVNAIHHYITQGTYAMFYDRSVGHRKRIENILLKLVEENKSWNEKMIEKEYEQITVYLKPKFTFATDEFRPTTLALDFLRQIMGVLGKESFVADKDEYYYNRESKEMLNIEKQYDKLCKEREIGECTTDNKCAIRKSSKGEDQCINSQRLRKIVDDRQDSYYILDDEHTINIFVPKCISKIVGYVGIFEYMQKNSKKFKVSKKFGKSKKYICTFPPFDEPYVKGGAGILDKIAFYKETFYLWYSHAYIQDFNTYDLKNVGVHTGMLKYIESWYNECFKPLNIGKNEDITIVGTSLGGGLANIATFYLLNNGYKHIHMYACGSPRVGDALFVEWMNSHWRKGIEPDSANFVGFNNIVKDNVFYTQCDPVTKFPPNSWSIFGHTGLGHLRWVDNPFIKLMGGSFVFNPVFETFSNQPHYDMVRPSKTPIPVSSDNEKYWDFVHSLGSYSSDVFQGALYHAGDDNPKYEDYYNQIINC